MNIVIIGATSEIAKEVGRIYSARKMELLLVGRNQEKLDDLKSDFVLRGAEQVMTSCHDFDRPEVYPQILQNVSQVFSKIDLLILAHGTLPTQLDIESDYTKIEEIARTNLLSYMNFLTIFGKKFEEQGHGQIAVFTSVAGDRGRRSNYIYGALKAAGQTFVEGYAARMSRSGVHVLDIRPGMVNTPMTAHLKKGLLFADPKNVAKDITKAISKRKSVVYTPRIWWPIMMIIRNIPRKILYKLNF